MLPHIHMSSLAFSSFFGSCIINIYKSIYQLCFIPDMSKPYPSCLSNIMRENMSWKRKSSHSLILASPNCPWVHVIPDECVKEWTNVTECRPEERFIKAAHLPSSLFSIKIPSHIVVSHVLLLKSYTLVLNNLDSHSSDEDIEAMISINFILNSSAKKKSLFQNLIFFSLDFKSLMIIQKRPVFSGRNILLQRIQQIISLESFKCKTSTLT